MRNHCIPSSHTDPKFLIDSALLDIELNGSFAGHSVLLAQSTECYTCPLMNICQLTENAMKLLVNTTYDTKMAVRDGETTVNCLPWPYAFGESGRYKLAYNGSYCNISDTGKPVDIHFPLYMSFVALLVVALIYGLVVIIHNRYYGLQYSEDASGDSELLRAELIDTQTVHRITSVDTFRGFCIALMILVNYGGGHYAFLKHSPWNGLTVADVVFPWFMFLMGVSTSLAFERVAVAKTSRRLMAKKTMRRSLVLFLLGLFVVNHHENRNWSTVRVMGVLQRFAVSYLFIGLMRLRSLQPAADIRNKQKRMSYLSGSLVELIIYGKDYVMVLTLLTLWFLLVFYVPIPGCPRGYLGPGGMANEGKYGNCSGGVTGYIDRLIFQPNHIHQKPSFAKLYNSNTPFDPEGILGCLPSIFTVFLGLQAGQIFVIYEKSKQRYKRFLYWAVFYGVVAGVLCGFSRNTGFLPINKNLWTPSFALAVSAMAMVILACLHYCVDRRQWWTGEPFYFIGMNPLLLYLFHEVFRNYLPVQWPVPNSHAAKLAMNLWGVIFWLAIAYIFHLKKYYVSL